MTALAASCTSTSMQRELLGCHSRQAQPLRSCELDQGLKTCRTQPEQGKRGVRKPLPGRRQVDSFTPLVRRCDERWETSKSLLKDLVMRPGVAVGGAGSGQ